MKNISHKQFYEDVVFTLTDKKSPSVGGKEGIKSLEIINAIYESAESGQEVFHPFEFKHTRLGGQWKSIRLNFKIYTLLYYPGIKIF